ncbi:MAG: alpha-2-macroglobulin [Desulfobacter sp.]
MRRLQPVIIFLAFTLLLPLFNMSLPVRALGGTAENNTSPGLEARFSGQQTVDGENALAVTFSQPLDPRQDLSPYFGLHTGDDTPVEGGWILAKDTHVAYFTNIEPDTTYKIRIARGLKAENGSTLEEAVAYDITTRPVEPMIVFGSKGFILASKLVKGLPVDTLNIKQADIDFFRIKPDRIGEFKENFWSSDYLHYYRSRDLGKIADLVYSGRWDLDIKKDLRTQVNIPVTHIKELKPPGIYFAVLRGAGNYAYGYSSTWFTISDLGVHARVYAQELDFYVQSLDSAEPVASAQVRGVDKKGRVLFSKDTDGSGKVNIPGRFDDLSLVSVTRDGHISLLPMDAPDLDLSEFKAGTMPYRPLDFFVYGPRDIYRPGETVHMDGLLRSHDVGMTPGVPIRARVIRPDGRMIREFTWKPGPGNHFYTDFRLPGNALTGRWTVELTHGAGTLDPYVFLVSEFLPERMKLDIGGDRGGESDREVLAPGDSLKIGVQGDFLYGAPAAGSRVNALVHVKPARELFKETWPGYGFGDVKHLINTSFTTKDVRLDAKGAGQIPVKNNWKDITSPHWVTANVSLYDSGGRPVVRNRSWQVWPAPALVGIRNLTAIDDDPGQVPEESTAEFEVMVADAGGSRLGATGLQATVIREHREYYWEFRNGEWRWGTNSQFYPVDRFTLDIPAGKTGRVRVPVKWGGYRLEIMNPDTGLTTAHEIWAGWRPESRGQSAMNRPDRVDISLDKAAYRPGDKARITLKAPEGGKGYLFVDADRNLLTMPVSLPARGKTVEILVDPSWQRHDIYVSALVIRPGQSRTANLPKRSVGLVHLPLDRTERKLGIEIRAPEKTEPGRTLQIPVTLTDGAGKPPADAWVTLAAVDVGILNLTGFDTPSPFDYFFRERRYGVGLRDVYQKLIEAGPGGYARQRFGGDAPALTRGGDRPATDVRIVAIHKTAVKTDDRGRAVFALDIPDFDGRLRLMAVAHTGDAFGSAGQDMVLASPLTVQANMPRFLAGGDRGELLLTLHNLTGADQDLSLDAEIFGPVTLSGEASHNFTLAASAKTIVRFPMAAGMKTGRATFTCRISGLHVDGASRDVVKTWFIETRPAYPPMTRAWKQRVVPGEAFSIGSDVLDGLTAGSIGVSAGMGATPPINLSDHVSQLLAYPYGCLEQTVSGLFPHVLMSDETFTALGLKTGSAEQKKSKIRLGIQRLLEKQKSSGGFGLWSSSSPENAWLTAYATHFFLNAHDAGFEIPESAVEKALNRLLAYVRRPNTIPYQGYVKRNAYKASARAYAAFILARVQSLSLGDARSVFAYVKKQGKDPLSLVLSGVALSMAGDRHTAEKAFDRAIKTRRSQQGYIGDYGSEVRDFAAAYYYLATYFPEYENKEVFLHELDAVLADREWLSTQERNALVMAGTARLDAPGASWQARVTVGGSADTMSGKQPAQAVFTGGVAAKGFDIRNTGATDLYVDVVLTGYPNTRPKALSQGVTISRRFLDTRGHPMDLSGVKSGDRVIVELRVTPEKRMPHALVVDMIPAGMELEDPNVSGSFLIDDIRVDQKPVREWRNAYMTAHTEYRDDRFITALDIRAGRTCRIFYPARVVSPGVFKVPASLVEDMYRPYVRGIGNTIDQMEVVQP